MENQPSGVDVDSFEVCRSGFPYGLAACVGRFNLTPEDAVGLSNARWDYTLDWRLKRSSGAPDGSALELAVELLWTDQDRTAMFPRTLDQAHTNARRTRSGRCS